MVVRGKSRKSTNTTEPKRPSPVSRIDKIASLKQYPDKDYALDLLHQMAKAVAPLVNEYKFKVGTLCEMFPKDANLLGLNVNRGQKILIRLRPSHNDRLFLPMRDLIGTLLHELTHNVHGPHDASFYAFLDELRRKYETGSFSAKDYVCEENTLGSGFTPPWATPQSVRQKRLQALSRGIFNAEVRKVGGKAPAAGDLRKAMLKAAERRLRDLKWCSQTRQPEDKLNKSDLEIQELALCKNRIPSAVDQSYKEIIDLTKDEVEDDNDIEIIEVEACKRSQSTSNPKTSVLEESSSFTVSSHLKMHSSMRYYVSTSPGRTFIGDESSSSRRKIVVELNLNQIIENINLADADPVYALRDDPLVDAEGLGTNTFIPQYGTVKVNFSPGVSSGAQETLKYGFDNRCTNKAVKAITSYASKKPSSKKHILHNNTRLKLVKVKVNGVSKNSKCPKGEQKLTNVYITRNSDSKGGMTNEKNYKRRDRKAVRCISFQELFSS